MTSGASSPQKDSRYAQDFGRRPPALAAPAVPPGQENADSASAAPTTKPGTMPAAKSAGIDVLVW
jgi:hypothetical protein